MYIEVPDTGRILAEGAFWDIYYEHCSYFTQPSIEYGLRRAGLNVDGIDLGYGDQYLMAHASAAQQPGAEAVDADLGELAESVVHFARSTSGLISKWRLRVEEELRNGGSVAVWGASSKAVGFLSVVPGVTRVVDVNPHKQGMWLPGVGLMVENPTNLASDPPTLVVPMNPIYLDEIREDLQRTGIHPAIEPV